MTDKMPDTVYISLYETTGKVSPEGYWPGDKWPCVFKQPRDRAKKYHSDAKYKALEARLAFAENSLKVSQTIQHDIAVMNTDLRACVRELAEVTKQYMGLPGRGGEWRMAKRAMEKWKPLIESCDE